MLSKIIFLAAAATAALANHQVRDGSIISTLNPKSEHRTVQVTVYNYCGQDKYAHVKSSQFDYVSGLLGTNGGSYSVSLPALASSLIVFGESGECPGEDGPVSVSIFVCILH